MNKTFVISDTHFGHQNIIKLANRPFQLVQEMDKTLIDNWNLVVGDNDNVMFGGDFAFYKNEDKLREIFNQLKGFKFLIKGNHDKDAVTKLPWALIIRDRVEFSHKDRMVVIDHYPLEDWNGRFRGAIHLYGHTHKAIREMTNRYCMCVEETLYMPVDLSDFVNRTKQGEKINE